jgi:hypothetical protein
MLTIRLATCETALDRLGSGDNQVDRELLTDLERLIERTRTELESLVLRDPPVA